MYLIQTSMQATAEQGQDDLSDMFYHNLSLNPDAHPPTQKEVPRQASVIALAAPPAQPVSYSISQHYNHSSHLVREYARSRDEAPQPQSQRPSSEPPRRELITSEDILRKYGVNPTNLPPFQMQLFREAGDAQKLRLLELWDIYPPNGLDDIPVLALTNASLFQDSSMDFTQYMGQDNPQMSLDGTLVQTRDSRWRSQPTAPESEPYMVSGYEELMRRENERQIAAYQSMASEGDGYRKATDPVYKRPDENAQQQRLDMASQYGAFEQSRGGNAEEDAMDL